MAKASLIICIVATVLSVVGLIPLLGVVNYIAIPLHIAAWWIGLLAVLFGAKHSEHGVTALVLSTVFFVVSSVRLWFGGGVL